jgi:hypothetical protein
MEHLSQEQLDALVMGTAPLDDDAVRRHLATCEACNRRLALEAQLESDLYGAAATAAGGRTTHPHFAPASMLRVALPLAAGLAVVAFASWSLITRDKLPRQDVCRCVTVELSQGPPSEPGSSDLCTAGENQ